MKSEITNGKIENEQIKSDKNAMKREAAKSAGKLEMDKSETILGEKMRSEATKNEAKLSKCDKMMDKFLMLDKQERIPLDVTFHLLKCKKCRTQVRYLSKAEKYASEPLKVSVPITDSKISAILKAANPRWSTENFKIKPVSMAKWIVCGILMLLFMTTYTFTAAKLGNEEANTFFYITFGIVITAYCAIFIASNLDFFIKKISSFTDETNCHERRFSGNLFSGNSFSEFQSQPDTRFGTRRFFAPRFLQKKSLLMNFAEFEKSLFRFFQSNYRKK